MNSCTATAHWRVDLITDRTGRWHLLLDAVRRGDGYAGKGRVGWHPVSSFYTDMEFKC